MLREPTRWSRFRYRAGPIQCEAYYSISWGAQLEMPNWTPRSTQSSSYRGYPSHRVWSINKSRQFGILFRRLWVLSSSRVFFQPFDFRRQMLRMNVINSSKMQDVWRKMYQAIRHSILYNRCWIFGQPFLLVKRSAFATYKVSIY